MFFDAKCACPGFETVKVNACCKWQAIAEAAIKWGVSYAEIAEDTVVYVDKKTLEELKKENGGKTKCAQNTT